MQVINSVTPSPERLQTLLGTDLSGPVSMLNLLKFKERAEYAAGLAGQLLMALDAGVGSG